MKKTRKSSMMVRLVAILTVTMMFTMCFVGGTFAKYTSSGTGSDTATVAKWSFKVGAADIAATDTFTFNLFNTIKDTDNSNESDINPSDGTIIAPGTQGSFDLVIKNESQVNATYAIDFSVTNTGNIPVQFSTDGTNWYYGIDLLDVSSVAINMGATSTVTVQWKWDFYGNDTTDTTLGAAGAATITVAAAVTATQVD